MSGVYLVNTMHNGKLEEKIFNILHFAIFTALVFHRFTIMRRLKQRSDRGTTTLLCILIFLFPRPSFDSSVPTLFSVFPLIKQNLV